MQANAWNVLKMDGGHRRIVPNQKRRRRHGQRRKHPHKLPLTLRAFRLADEKSDVLSISGELGAPTGERQANLDGRMKLEKVVDKLG
ncbi:hypothetical protein AWB74_08230 [Caballeronia arvi]|uniref:Uncharacterized protein n=1 Tax=Caballeronia arvi TaxID=1777135 RepID=A0A158L4B1_9BURK|nr:hypothetical protein AWB74_08230 [Caballeronia arvi]